MREVDKERKIGKFNLRLMKDLITEVRHQKKQILKIGSQANSEIQITNYKKKRIHINKTQI